MDISPTHLTTRNTAARNPANAASLSLLQSATTDRATIALYANTKPAPGDPAGADPPIVEIELTTSAGTLDELAFTIILTTPLEGQVTGAHVSDGSIPVWGRILGPLGDWWSDVTVSVEGGAGEIQIAQTGVEASVPVARLFNGAFCRIISAVFEG